MKKHFYHNIISVESLTIALQSTNLSESEKNHLIEIVNSSLHYAVLDLVLSELADEDKKVFLKHVSASDHDSTWDLLKKKTNNIEEKIKTAADKLIKELEKDIEETRH